MNDKFTMKENGNYNYRCANGTSITVFRIKDETGFRTEMWSYVIIPPVGDSKFCEIPEYTAEDAMWRSLYHARVPEFDDMLYAAGET